MKRSVFIVFASLLFISAQAQNGAAVFNDSSAIIITNGSAMIANSSSMTIEGWVFPRNTAPSFPNFDGFFGWRNEFDADFYLLHLNTNRIEGRLRTNLGVYTVADTGLHVNQWNHIALSYDGSTLRMFINGNASTTLPAAGTINDTTETLFIGNLPFQNTNFYFDGLVDEFRVWRSARTLSEINSLRFVELVNPSSYPDLSGYYKLNDTLGSVIAREGVGGRNGTVQPGVTFTNSTAPLFNGPTGFSNRVICNGDSVLIGKVWRKIAGTYRDTIMRAGMQDSLVFIQLMVAQKPLIPGIVKSDWDSLSCNIMATSYTWFRDGMKLSDTSQKIKFRQSGDYRVIAYNFQCASDTSLAFNFQLSGLSSEKVLSFDLFPNPTRAAINIIGSLNAEYSYRMLSLSGSELFRSTFRKETILDLKGIESGFYLLEVSDKDGRLSRKKVLKLD